MHRKSLSTMWIDYCKAYDSVPHPRILGCIKFLVLFFQKCMSLWNTQVFMVSKTESIDVRQVSINCGVTVYHHYFFALH